LDGTDYKFNFLLKNNLSRRFEIGQFRLITAGNPHPMEYSL
jgi:hypothetical protein